MVILHGWFLPDVWSLSNHSSLANPWDYFLATTSFSSDHQFNRNPSRTGNGLQLILLVINWHKIGNKSATIPDPNQKIPSEGIVEYYQQVFRCWQCNLWICISGEESIAVSGDGNRQHQGITLPLLQPSKAPHKGVHAGKRSLQNMKYW